MGRVFKRLERVLELETQQGYQNKAVVGGIRQFAIFWVEQARDEVTSETDKALVEQVGEVLTGYGKLPGGEARAKSIEGIMASLRRRESLAAKTSEPGRAAGASKAASSRDTEKLHAQPKRREEPVRHAPLGARRKENELVQTAKPLPGELTKPVPTELPTAEPDPIGLAQPVTKIKRVGPKLSELLLRLGVESINDLLRVYPRRYDDYTLMKPVKDLVYGEQVTVIGTIWETRARRTRNNQVLVQTIVSDGTANIQATWFNQPWLADKLEAGMQIVLSGKVDQYLGRPVFNSPEWEPLELQPLRTRRIVPVYPLTEGLTSNKMRDIMRTAVSEWAPRVPDPLPDSIRNRRAMLGLPHAIQGIHFPTSTEELHRARQRLVFDELLTLQLGMLGQRQRWQSHTSKTIPFDQVPLIRLQNSLPFELTSAQRRVIEEIGRDMARDVPMNRLLQGDVGSGKTVVAAAAMLMAANAGFQAALMAPTEILAEQHFSSLRELLSSQGVELRLLTGSTSAANKASILSELREGHIQAVVGTHALIQDSVEFGNLALAIIDEQHRFGVEQRQMLKQKGISEESAESVPHLLVMSATPIPRTLALSLYGDLDPSILDEMPPGRQEIRTRWLQPSERERAYSFIRGQAAQGRQAYMIFPLVEESDKIDAKSAVEEYQRLQNQVFPNLRLGLVHGRLKSEDKEHVMRDFYAGEIDILVATSVIEVGVDVPNSTVMLIDGAERFGLAQLHQFRGRVGRGEHQSYCLLIANGDSPDAEERLQALEQTNDGFLLAEKDLELRGPGEFFGRRQSGIPELRLASLLDMEMLETAREEAESVFAADPMLENAEHAGLRECMERFWQDASEAS